MEKAKLNVIEFDNNDVIATSGFLTLSGFGDGDPTNQKMTYNNKFVDCDSTEEAWTDMFTAARGVEGSNTFTNGGSKWNDTVALYPNKVITATKDNYPTWLNNSFVYDKESGKFVIKQ